MCLLAPGDNGRPKFTAEQAVELYTERGDDIFDISVWQKISSLKGLSDEKYSADELEEALEDYLEDQELKDLLLPCLITAYNIRLRAAHFFRQHRADDDAYNFYLKDVCRATSAAPTYFEVSRIKSKTKVRYPLIDGGVFANNPSLCAYSEARSHYGVGAADMLVVSLGTGQREQSYSYSEAKDWGPIGWAKPVLDIMMSGVAETVDYQLGQIFESVERQGQYHRIQVDLPRWVSSELDRADRENMRRLEEVGETLAYERSDEIIEIADQVIEAGKNPRR